MVPEAVVYHQFQIEVIDRVRLADSVVIPKLDVIPMCTVLSLTRVHDTF